ncbi:Proton/glutamate symport protein / Sodium/glutamate symport protein [Methanosarcina horonobensis HB-1 = JCM 15518]|uniref:Proton/glutamate symport protein / Sodium/glutamate symport protein n=1 Tax=Methanosarcina horonobensis HB-1 = JCM 15518 TaxID=1434110 RepID=A0A0E3SDU4_9EURY|nr:dicarboxylate/amino acid:cation symporter [Methanosarcina horonobensis]AKB78292.1 Proton/glutamate symport protein / Sodium/glutamate symport protein [Methanosarcina horonobensis HB-1 = JCM 15518]
MKDKDNRYIPNPREFAQEIAEETRMLRNEITGGIMRIYYPLDFRRNNSLKSLSNQLRDLLEKKLWLKILIGMGLGVFLGLFLGPFGGYVDPVYAEIIGEWIALPGYIFLGLLKMIVVPLVFASIILGVASSQSMSALKKTGVSTAIYFVITTAIATAIGLGMALYIRPGQFISGDLIESAMGSEVQAGSIDLSFDTSILTLPASLIGGLFPSNPLGALVSGEMLQVVIIAIIIGVALVSLNKDQSTPMVSFLNSVQAVCMTVVKWSMSLAPIAVFGLLTKFTIKLGIEALLGMAVYVGTVLASLLLLMCLNLFIVSVVARYNPFEFLNAIRDVMLLAFSTSSSAAVMPLSIKTAEERLGVRPSISQFVVPLGATVNMNGTALYQGVATIFLAEVFGIDLGPFQLLVVMVMAVAASIGTPSIPGVGIVVLAMILSSVGIPTSGIALIMGVDRILDMSRTAVNVAGDLVTCKVMDRWVGGEVKENVNEIANVETKASEEKIDDKVKTNTDLTASESSSV